MVMATPTVVNNRSSSSPYDFTARCLSFQNRIPCTLDNISSRISSYFLDLHQPNYTHSNDSFSKQVKNKIIIDNDNIRDFFFIFIIVVTNTSAISGVTWVRVNATHNDDDDDDDIK